MKDFDELWGLEDLNTKEEIPALKLNKSKNEDILLFGSLGLDHLKVLNSNYTHKDLLDSPRDSDNAKQPGD